MAELIRCITSDGAVMASAIDSTDIVSRAEQLHKTSAVVTAGLGRLLTAASMMGNMRLPPPLTPMEMSAAMP